MNLNQHIDSVIILSASNWFTEPRSNRYHFATRFARELPTFFVQFDRVENIVETEKCEVENLEITHLSSELAPNFCAGTINSKIFQVALDDFHRRGCKKPLIWVYNPFAAAFARAFASPMLVYHATESYLIEDDDFFAGAQSKENQLLISNRCKELIGISDVIIAVSTGVKESIESHGNPTCPVLGIYNGVDADFWLKFEAYNYVAPPNKKPVALFQGGINRRLDYPLIEDVARRMPDWEFWFCGNEDKDNAAWKNIKNLSNVTYHGPTKLERIAALAQNCTIGWAPFLDVALLRTSMPLKMFEYVACGLPVVSTPIDGLMGTDKNLFRVAKTAKEFEKYMRELGDTRTDSQIINKRIEAAKKQSYDSKFSEVKTALHNVLAAGAIKKNILVLYDDKSTHLPAIQWHLSSFKSFSRNQIFYAPASCVDGDLKGGGVFQRRPGS